MKDNPTILNAWLNKVKKPSFSIADITDWNKPSPLGNLSESIPIPEIDNISIYTETVPTDLIIAPNSISTYNGVFTIDFPKELFFEDNPYDRKIDIKFTFKTLVNSDRILLYITSNPFWETFGMPIYEITNPDQRVRRDAWNYIWADTVEVRIPIFRCAWFSDTSSDVNLLNNSYTYLYFGYNSTLNQYSMISSIHKIRVEWKFKKKEFTGGP